ncbi:MAG: hypothetical protein IKJ39_10625 [Lachnospiraceae bacterium]|nr:hypothetical protein [Lachnospiraceae bacterium]
MIYEEKRRNSSHNVDISKTQICLFLGKLPLTAAGKVDFRQLEEQYEGEQNFP